MAVVERALTLLRLPEDETALELQGGTVTWKVAPEPDHGILQSYISERFNVAARPKRVGLSFTETRFVAGQDAFVPDVSFYTRARVRPRTRRSLERFQEAPDIAVEIRSPGQSVAELLRKCLGFLDLGSRATLLVVPEDELIFIFRPGQQPRAWQGDDRIDLDDILPDLSLTMQEVFGAVVPEWLLEDGSPAE